LTFNEEAARQTRDSFRALAGDDREYQAWVAFKNTCTTSRR
jgi:hypothetical protein